MPRTPQQLAQEVLDAHVKHRALTAHMAVAADAFFRASSYADQRARAHELGALRLQLQSADDILGKAILAYRDRVEKIDAHRIDLQRQLDALATQPTRLGRAA